MRSGSIARMLLSSVAAKAWISVGGVLTTATPRSGNTKPSDLPSASTLAPPSLKSAVLAIDSPAALLRLLTAFAPAPSLHSTRKRPAVPPGAVATDARAPPSPTELSGPGTADVDFLLTRFAIDRLPWVDRECTGSPPRERLQRNGSKCSNAR